MFGGRFGTTIFGGRFGTPILGVGIDTWILGSQKFAKYPKKSVSKSIQEYPRVSKSIHKSQTSSSMSPKCQEVWRKNMFFFGYLDTWIPKICQVSKKIGIQEYP